MNDETRKMLEAKVNEINAQRDEFLDRIDKAN